MFYTAWFCYACNGELTNREVMYSHGRCPKCGHKDAHACTIVRTYEKAYTIEKIPSGKWWIFDKRARKYAKS